ncbi:DUF2442 domain-containing protein [Roseomonas sp. NAR14]|uniref:DUF2442 domain-containing protein n=1 Tax=Roseomonas acroporae TaxID=2937791 RepID=A0A9X1YCN2_9PROT|nr:DUF2442 domain-containing protein [Roseomonas acroporae]MCK8787989.1 DUF2442 domain-containing protein [Roseomonas acroporae]
MIEEQRITGAHMAPGYRLHLTFADGAQGVVDLAPLVARGKVYRAIEAAPGAFRLVFDGTAIEWPDGAGDVVDFCADALRMQMVPARAAAE